MDLKNIIGVIKVLVDYKTIIDLKSLPPHPYGNNMPIITLVKFNYRIWSHNCYACSEAEKLRNESAIKNDKCDYCLIYDLEKKVCSSQSTYPNFVVDYGIELMANDTDFQILKNKIIKRYRFLYEKLSEITKGTEYENKVLELKPEESWK